MRKAIDFVSLRVKHGDAYAGVRCFYTLK